MSNYEAWRITFQSSEQAARAAFQELQAARAQQGEAEPVAWTWRHGGRHVTADKPYADQLRADGVDVSPLCAHPPTATGGVPYFWASEPQETEQRIDGRKRLCLWECKPGVGTPLYTHPAVPDVVAWGFCPECGSDDANEYPDTLRVCNGCGQDWHTDVDYTEVIRRNLSALHNNPPTATAGRVLEGWKLVPIEPTKEMRLAFHEAHEAFEDGDEVKGSPDDEWVAMIAAAPSPEQSKPRNRYGVDAPYFHGKLKLILRDVENYTPDELARSLARLVVVADKAVLAESEFAPEQAAPGRGWIRCSERLPDPRRPTRKAPNGILAKYDCGRITQIREVTKTLVEFMRNGPRKPLKYESHVNSRIVEWLDLDAANPPAEGE